MAKQVKAKANWFTPSQRIVGFQTVWQNITAEDIDLKAFAEEPRITYYNTPFKQHVRHEYDLRFNFSLDFDPKAHRDDRHNLNVVRDNFYKEERLRVLPIVTSQNYGHRRYNLEGPTYISHKRLRVMDEIMRRFRVNVKPSKKLPEAVEMEFL